MRLLYLRNLGMREISCGRSNAVDFTLFLCCSVKSIEQGSQEADVAFKWELPSVRACRIT